MVDNSGFVAGGGIPEGDQYRETSVVTLLDETLTTVLSESSGSGGVLYGFWFVAANSNTRIQEIRTTVDGASERTWSWGGFFYDFSKTTTSSNTGIIWIPTPINYTSSVTLKVEHNDSSSSQCYAKAVYSLKA